jgi:3-hydroxyisobutyrate dehydrogenase
MAAYARICRRWATAGAGQVAKMMNQICIAGLMQGLSEALAFGQKAGLDGEKVVEVISARAPPGLADGEPPQDHAGRHFRLRLCRGLDAQGPGICLEICLDTADEIGAAPAGHARLVDQFYKDRAD